MAHDVLISYSQHDKRQADAICNRLESQGIRCWIAPRDVPLGSEYADSIVQAIESAQALVLVYSQNADQSDMVRREVERAVSEGIHIMPVRIEDAPMSSAFEYYVGSIHWLDAITPPLEAHIDKLAQGLQALLGQGPTAGEAASKAVPRPDAEPGSPSSPGEGPLGTDMPPPPRGPDSDTRPDPGPEPAPTGDSSPHAGGRQPGGVGLGTILAVTLLIVLVGVGYWWQTSRTQTIVAVLDQSEEAATTALEGLGLGVTVRLVDDAGRTRGTAAGTDPPAGTRVRRGTTVTLLVAGTVTVPRLEGMTEDSAKVALTGLGIGAHRFPPGAIAVEYVFEGEEGRVARVSPQAGESILLGETVTLYVAGDKARVPDVSGASEADAVAAIEREDLNAVVDVDWKLEAPLGSVLGTDPEAGTAVDRGSDVVVTVKGDGGWAHYVELSARRVGDTVSVPINRTVRSNPQGDEIGTIRAGTRVRILEFSEAIGGYLKFVRLR